MATVPTPTRAPVAAANGERRTRLRAPQQSWALVVVVVLVVLPLVVTLVSLVGTRWHPSSDVGIEILRVGDVGGRHTPLTGVQSRFGWDHPGPLLFWSLAPPYRLLGDTGVLFGVGALNGGAIAGALLVGARRGGVRFVVLLGVTIILLVRALGTDLLVDPWNPWIAVLPFLLYVLLAWSVAERDFACLAGLVGVGTFLVQTHLGYAPLVVGLGVVAGLLAWRGHREPSDARLARWLRLAGVVGAVLWLAPMVQQFTGSPGNLGEIVEYFRDPTEPPLGWSVGYGIMGRQLSVPGPWITGHDVGPYGTIATGSTIVALGVLAATAGAAVAAWRRGARSAARFAVLALAATAFGVGAGARATGLTGSYVVRWWWVIAATVWCSLAWCVWSLVDRTRAARRVEPVALGALAVLCVLTAVQAIPASPPESGFSDAVGALAPRVARALDPDRRYLVVWVDIRDLGAVGIGTFLDLSERGYEVRATRPHAHGFGSWRVADPDAVDGIVTVVAGDDVSAGWTPPPRAVLIASYDALSPADRERARVLEQQLEGSLGPGPRWSLVDVDRPAGRAGLRSRGAEPAVLDALAVLREQGSAYTVYLSAPE